MVASASATGSCSPSLPLELVPIFLVVAVTVAEAVEKLDSKLFTAVKRRWRASLPPVRARSCNGCCRSRSACSLHCAPPTTPWPSSLAVLSTRRLRAEQMACQSDTGPLIHWWFMWRPSGFAAAGQQSKGVTRVRASGMLIPTAGLLHLRQASMDVAVSISRAHAAAAPARRACADRVHVVR